jgi:hypothetical protein
MTAGRRSSRCGSIECPQRRKRLLSRVTSSCSSSARRIAGAAAPPMHAHARAPTFPLRQAAFAAMCARARRRTLCFRRLSRRLRWKFQTMFETAWIEREFMVGVPSRGASPRPNGHDLECVLVPGQCDTDALERNALHRIAAAPCRAMLNRVLLSRLARARICRLSRSVLGEKWPAVQPAMRGRGRTSALGPSAVRAAGHSQFRRVFAETVRYESRDSRAGIDCDAALRNQTSGRGREALRAFRGTTVKSHERNRKPKTRHMTTVAL